MSKRVLLTGGAGFIGHHFVEHILKETDWEIIILDSLNYAGNLNRITDIDIWEEKNRSVKFVWHDLKSPIPSTTSEMIGKVDYIIHLAAESHVDRSLQDSIPFVMSNVVGTANLLEWMKKENPQAITNVFSTDEVVGPAPVGTSFKEDALIKPSNPYSASKAGEEAIAFSFAHSFGLPIFITRTMNVFGERQFHEKFIPTMIRRILMRQGDEKLKIHGDPKTQETSSRHWIHAREVARAILFLLENAKREEIYNVVGEEKESFYLASRINKIIKKRELSKDEMEYMDYHSCRPGHDFRYSLDNSKLLDMGYKYKISLDDSFDKMIRWSIMPEHAEWLNLSKLSPYEWRVRRAMVM